MIKNKIILISCFIIIPVFSIYSQITGVVYENTEQGKSPLVGVNIFWKDSNIGTVSNKDGSFTIATDEGSKKLIFSYIGYNPDTLKIVDYTEKLEVVLESAYLLDEVTVGERRGSTFYSRLETVSTQTITTDELCRSACCNLSESFETNPTVDASFSDAVTGARQIQMLGLAGKYVSMMTENIPNLYGVAQPYGLMYIPGTWMEEINISKGTANVINGYEGITGQINVEYKKPQTSEKLFFNKFASSSGMLEANFNGSYLVNDNLSTMAFAHKAYQGREMDHNNNGFMDEPMINRNIFFNRWDYFKNDFTIRFGVKYLSENRKTGQIGHNFGDNNDANYYGINIDTERIDAFYKMGYVFPEKQYQSIAMMSNFVYHDQASYYGLNAYDANHKSSYLNLMWQSAFGGDLGHRYNFGLSFKHEIYDEMLTDSIFNFTEMVPGAYFQYTAGFIENFNFIAGARVDKHNEFGLLYTPRLHFKYDISNSLILRASAGKAFRYANIIAENSFLLASSRNFMILENLDIEEAWNYGLNLSYNFKLNNRDMSIYTEFYRTEFINQIIVDFETPGELRFYNLNGESFSNVFQTEVSYNIYKSLDVTVAFRLNDVKQTIGDELKLVPLTPRYRGLITASYETNNEKWQFDYTIQFNGGGRIPSTLNNPEKYRIDDSFKPYNIHNIQISKYFKNMDIYVGVENITSFVQDHPIIAFDEPFGDYFDSALIWGPIFGRKFYIGLRYRFDRK